MKTEPEVFSAGGIQCHVVQGLGMVVMASEHNAVVSELQTKMLARETNCTCLGLSAKEVCPWCLLREAREELAALRDLLTRAIGFAGHDEDCVTNRVDSGKCSCGYSEFLREAQSCLEEGATRRELG